MSFLERLPPEVVLIILEDVDGWHRPELARLVRTSRTLYTQLNPRLWRVVILETSAALQSFVRALFPTMLSKLWQWISFSQSTRCAELASLVQHLALKYSGEDAIYRAVPLLQACRSLQSLQLDVNYRIPDLSAHIEGIPKLSLAFRPRPIFHPLPPLHCTHLQIHFMDWTTIENLPQLRVLSFDVNDHDLHQIDPDPKLVRLVAQIRVVLAIPTLDRVVIRIFARAFASQSMRANLGMGRSGKYYRVTATSALYNNIRQLNDKRIRFTVLDYADIDDHWLRDALGSDKVFEGSKSIMGDPISLFEPED